ncbi:hypothetical protein [Taibaiella koreensis]|uniref:hypothetical protein n=1 Tax=Taibaiella koreensis TaxID=1268548 RepID=UPI000E5A0861|nr:hypothetical protein [Taibaiella koreensis]
MHEIKDPVIRTEIERYTGIPNGSSVKVKSAWKRFIEFITPWLNEKRLLAERLLEAEVRKREAEALNTTADAELKFQQAKKIATETAIMEQDKLNTIDINHISVEDIEATMQSLKDKLAYLSAVHGTRIDIYPSKGESK